MRPFLRFAALIAVVGCLMLGVPIASAQSPCVKGLANADCTLITKAGANLAKLQKGALDYTLTLQITGLTTGSVNLTSKGTGGFDASAVTGDTLADALAKLVFDLKSTSSLTYSGVPQNGDLEIKEVDGNLYALGTLVADAGGAKYDVAKVVTAMLSRSKQPLPGDNLSLDILGGMIKSFDPVLAPVYTFKSQAGKTIDSQATTQITMDISLANYYTYISDHPEALKALLERSGQTVTDTQVDDMITVLAVYATILKATKIQESWAIGKKDNQYHGWGLTLTTTIDSATITNLHLENDPNPKPIKVNFSLQVNITKIGTAVTVTPEDAAVDHTGDVIASLTGQPPTTTNSSSSDATLPDNVGAAYDGLKMGKSSQGFATLGSANAPVRIVQMSSYSCGACKKYFTTQIIPVLDEVKAGKANYTFIPVTVTGEFDSTPEVKAAYCALQQNKFWEMHDVLFDWQDRYGAGAAENTRLTAAATALGLDDAKFSACLTSTAATRFVTTANDLFAKANLNSTPSILINDQLFYPSNNTTDLRSYIEDLANGGSPSDGGTGGSPAFSFWR
jgi:protein-disulfide isomerase